MKDRVLSHAVAAAYADLLPRGRSPVLVLLIALPPEQVDVNVHPSKSEVRFRRPREIHDLIVTSLRDALRGAGAFPSIALGPASSSLPSIELAAGLSLQGGQAGPDPTDAPWTQEALPGTEGYSYSRGAIAGGAAGTSRGSDQGPWLFSDPGTDSVAEDARPPSGSAAASEERGGSVHPLGQFLDSYVLARDGEGLLIIDQHAAHERVLFEGILGGDAGREAPAAAQRLLTPVPVGLSAAEREALLRQADPLARSGFEIDEFGTETVLLRSVPTGCDRADPQRLLRDVLSDLRLGQPASSLDDLRRRIAASAACHAAIKVHFPLTVAKMEWLLGALFRCATPTTCPHGRPIVLRIGREEIERGFLRR